MTDGQAITKAVYEDPIVVRASQEADGKSADFMEDFARGMLGLRLLDLGCGPGTDARHFTKRP